MSHCVALFTFVPANDFSKYAQDRGLKIDTEFVLYGLHDGSAKIMSSATIFGAVVNDPENFQREPYGIASNYMRGADLVFIKAVVTPMDSFSLLYLYELHWYLIDEAPEILEEVSTNGFICQNFTLWKQLGRKAWILFRRRHPEKIKLEKNATVRIIWM